MQDERFRVSLPIELQDDVQKYLENPSCKCNLPIYKRVAKECPDQIKAYFPGKKIADFEEDFRKAENSWRVINCHINQLENELRKLPIGRKQVDVARYKDQVTVVVNELDLIY
jgi:hypothetical protein